MQTVTISGLHCTTFALASSAHSYLVLPILIYLQCTSCTNITLVCITFIDGHFQLINSCHKFPFDGLSNMRDAFLAHDLYWKFLHFISYFYVIGFLLISLFSAS